MKIKSFQLHGKREDREMKKKNAEAQQKAQSVKEWEWYLVTFRLQK